MVAPLARKTIQLGSSDLTAIIKALELYDHHITLMNSDIFRIDENTLSDLHNEGEYIRALIRHLREA